MTVTARVVRRKKGRRLPAGIIGHKKVKVGFPATKTNQDVLNKAIWNHFGTRNIPERPFLSNAMNDNRSKYIAALNRSAFKILSGETTVGEVTLKLGILAQGDVQTEIVNLSDPANAPATIKKKGSSNPLIDTGEMKNSVTFVTYD